MGEPKAEWMIEQLGKEIVLMLELRITLINARILIDKIEKMREKKFCARERRATK